ncbi:MAG TPA: hypothetical protein VHX44_06595 [Planctomycetota bacterium]|nr:hypothetical protein [Planctomycetota bacterium]
MRSRVRLVTSSGIALLAMVCSARFAPGVELAEGDLKDVIHYAIHAPVAPLSAETPAKGKKKDAPTKQLGLFLCFHEHVGDVKEEGLHAVESLERLKLTGDYVVIAPKAPAATQFWDNRADMDKLTKLIDWAKATYPINPRRVFIWGRGAGAAFGGQYALKYPQTIAGVILFSWGFNDVPKIENPQATLPDFFYILGLKDLDTHVATVRFTYALLRGGGLKVIYREVADLGGATTSASANDEAMTWAHQTRHKTQTLSPDELDQLKPWASASAAKAAKSDDLFPKLAEVGGPHTGSLYVPFFAAKSEGVRVTAIKTCTQALFGDEVNTALGKLLDDKSARIRQAAVEALTWNATFRNAPAQAALLKLALDTKAEVSDRGMAVDGIVHVLSRQTEGAFQDTDLFGALVTLLDDKSPALRIKAFTFLGPLRSSTYRPDAGDKERTAAVAEWRTWIEGLVGKNGVGKHTGPIKQ